MVWKPNQEGSVRGKHEQYRAHRRNSARRGIAVFFFRRLGIFPPHEFAYGSPLKNIEALAERINTFLSLEPLDPRTIQIQTSSGTAVRAQTIKIKLVNGKKGRPVARACVNTWVDTDQKDAMAIPIDKDGVAWLYLTDKDADMNARNQAKNCGLFGVVHSSCEARGCDLGQYRLRGVSVAGRGLLVVGQNGIFDKTNSSGGHRYSQSLRQVHSLAEPR